MPFNLSTKATKKPHKQGKRISKNFRSKHSKISKHLKKSYSPQYNPCNLNDDSPQYYSDDYKPELVQQDETKQIYDQYIDKKTIQRMQEQSQQFDQMEITNKLAHINI